MFLNKASSEPVTVQYATSGSATPGKDYDPINGSITIPAGETQDEIVIIIYNDSCDGENTPVYPVCETDETVFVTIESATNADDLLSSPTAYHRNRGRRHLSR